MAHTDFLRQYGGTRTGDAEGSAAATMGDGFLAETLRDYAKMDRTGKSLSGRLLSNRELAQVRRMLPILRREAERRKERNG